MGIRVLEEAHKRFAEMMLTGKPPTKREQAADLGVDRSTLYNWAKDPLFQTYLAKLSEELEAARVERMSPLVATACEAIQACLSNALTDLQSDDKAHAPSMSTLVSAVKVLVELERTDRGKPSRITKREEERTEKPSPATEKLLKWLNELAADDAEGEGSETHTAAPPVTH